MAGFECEFVDRPPKAFQCECPICLLVLREPFQATCCGNSFCKQCADRAKAKARGKVCPTCNGRNFDLFHNLGLQRSLYDFHIYCIHKSKGCEWTGELRELDNHLNSDPPADNALQGCPFTPIKCPLSCVGCEKGVCRKDIKSHVNDKLLGHVMMQTARIKSLEEHLQEQIKKGKQDKQCLEKRMTELETNVYELGMNNEKLNLKNRELENEIKTLTVRQAEVVPEGLSDQPISKQQQQQPDTHITGTYKPSGAEFTMTNFVEYQKDDDEWHSPHFYTHPNGYKMCLNVHANGYGTGEGTHLSVYVCLMKGEFDNQLKWPIHSDVTVKLMNQEEDKNHIVETICFTGSTQKSNQRVTAKERSDCVLGFGQFLPLTELQPKYLKNNCIKFCIKSVEIF